MSLLLILNTPAHAQDLEGMDLDKGIKVTGGVNISNIAYMTNDSSSRRDPYQLILSGNLNIDFFGYGAPFTFTYSNSQRSYTQPFNRFSFTPKYKWIKAYIGRTSMTFSPYTLSGHTFNGAGVELTPGNWRFAIMGGQLKKAVTYDLLTVPLSNPVFRRMGYGLKLGFEKTSTGITVNIFTAKDDRHSIGEIPANFQIHPMQNIAMGLDAYTTLLKHFILEANYSISILNSDTRFGAIQNDSGPGIRRFDAYSAGAGYQSSVAGILLKYERVAPDYQSLGAYYFNNDLENFTIAPSLRLLEGKLSLNGNIGLQRNNLDKLRESTTKRFAAAGNMTVSVTEELNFTMNYSNFSTYTNVKPQEDPFFRNNMDTLNFYQVTNQAVGTINYTFLNRETPGNLLLLASYQKAREKGSGTVSDFLTANVSYTQVLSSSGMALSFLYNISSSISPELESLYQGPGVSISRTFKKKNIRISANSNFNLTRLNSLKGPPVLATGININYPPRETGDGKHNLTTNLSWVQRFSSDPLPGRREITATVNYTYSF